MPIKYEKRNITSITEGVIGHGCNIAGAFGSGVAGAIRQKWPKMYETYMTDFNSGVLKLGFTHVVNLDDSLHIANIMTQEKYGMDGNVYADIEAIEEGLHNLCAYATVHNLDVYIPPIGCGLGGLNWKKDVLPRIEKVSSEYPELNITVCDI